jgi:ferrochelatase
MASPQGVVLLGMGGPDTLEAVEPFLCRLLSDPLIFPVPGARLLAPLIARRRARTVRPYYARIGGGSPLCAATDAQARALGAALGDDFLVQAAFRYWGRDADQVAAALHGAGVRRAVALPMYPQSCRATTLSSLRDFRRAAGRHGLALADVDGFHDDPAYLYALAGGVRAALARFSDGAAPHLLLSAHGVPRGWAHNGDPYAGQVERTARLLMTRLPRGTPWSLGWQSRMGPLRWIEPATDAELRRLAAAGVRRVLMVPLTFVAEHVETLDEMDIRLRDVAERAGVREFARVPALGDDPDFIAALAGLVRRRLEATA